MYGGNRCPRNCSVSGVDFQCGNNFDDVAGNDNRDNNFLPCGKEFETRSVRLAKFYRNDCRMAARSNGGDDGQARKIVCAVYRVPVPVSAHKQFARLDSVSRISDERFKHDTRSCAPRHFFGSLFRTLFQRRALHSALFPTGRAVRRHQSD